MEKENLYVVEECQANKEDVGERKTVEEGAKASEEVEEEGTDSDDSDSEQQEETDQEEEDKETVSMADIEVQTENDDIEVITENAVDDDQDDEDEDDDEEVRATEDEDSESDTVLHELQNLKYLRVKHDISDSEDLHATSDREALDKLPSDAEASEVVDAETIPTDNGETDGKSHPTDEHLEEERQVSVMNILEFSVDQNRPAMADLTVMGIALNIAERDHPSSDTNKALPAPPVYQKWSSSSPLKRGPSTSLRHFINTSSSKQGASTSSSKVMADHSNLRPVTSYATLKTSWSHSNVVTLAIVQGEEIGRPHSAPAGDNSAENLTPDVSQNESPGGSSSSSIGSQGGSTIQPSDADDQKNDGSSSSGATGATS